MFRHHDHIEFPGYSCDQGRLERWTHTNLIYQQEEFFETIESSERPVWLISHAQPRSPFEQRIVNDYAAFRVSRSVDDLFDVYRIEPSGD